MTCFLGIHLLYFLYLSIVVKKLGFLRQYKKYKKKKVQKSSGANKDLNYRRKKNPYFGVLIRLV